MPLSSILGELAADEGIPLNTSAERAYLTDIINKAAAEIYNTYDLRGSLREQVFNVGKDQQLVSLPWYVENIRKIRQYDFRFPVDYNAMQMRYHVNEWQTPLVSWREHRRDSALKRDIENHGPLTFTLTEAATVPFAVTITGKTPAASRYTEIITFLAGETAKTSTKSYENIESFTKNKAIDQDMSVTDMDGNEVSFIANRELKPRYTIVQVLDRWNDNGEDVFAEVLFKLRFTPFVHETDSFPCGDVFDRCIYWKAVSHLYTKQEGAIAQNKVIGAEAKFKQLIEAITANDNQGKVNMLDFAPNKYFNMFGNLWLQQ
jgi:hypothetical protein